jgi:hypothetical protein
MGCFSLSYYYIFNVRQHYRTDNILQEESTIPVPRPSRECFSAF